jgi:ribosomal protein S18 acetylase RimI-like enzyme
MTSATPDRPSPRERRALLEVLAQAFLDNPMNRRIHGPDPGRRLRANRAGLRSLVLDERPGAEARVVRHAGRVAGGFVAVAPGFFPLPGASLARQLGCLFHQGARAMQQWGAVTESLGRAHPSEPHWYLAVLGVAPTCWGLGLGGQLVDALSVLTARAPGPIYLESDRAESVAFYRARGFEVVGEQRILGVPCWRLVRTPTPHSSGDASDLCNAVARRTTLD